MLLSTLMCHGRSPTKYADQAGMALFVGGSGVSSYEAMN